MFIRREVFTLTSVSGLLCQIANSSLPISSLSSKRVGLLMILGCKSLTFPCVACSLQVLCRSWTRVPAQRIPFSTIVKMLQRSKPSRKSVVECMMDTLEEYVTQLEDKVRFLPQTSLIKQPQVFSRNHKAPSNF